MASGQAHLPLQSGLHLEITRLRRPHVGLTIPTEKVRESLVDLKHCPCILESPDSAVVAIDHTLIVWPHIVVGIAWSRAFFLLPLPACIVKGNSETQMQLSQPTLQQRPGLATRPVPPKWIPLLSKRAPRVKAAVSVEGFHVEGKQCKHSLTPDKAAADLKSCSVWF